MKANNGKVPNCTRQETKGAADVYIYIYTHEDAYIYIYAFLESCTSPTSTLRCPADVAVTNPSQRNSCELEEKWLRVLGLHVELW